MTLTDEPIVLYDADDPQFRIDESPFSASTTDNWVAKLGGLPPYIRGVTRGIMKSGHSFEDALPIAIGVMKTWAAGGPTWGHKSHASAAVRAKAAGALAHWEAMKAASGGGHRECTIEASSTRAIPGGPGVNNAANQVKGAYATGHPFFGNQHTGSLGKVAKPVRKLSKNEASQMAKAHKTASTTAGKTAHVTAHDTAVGIAPGSPQAKAAYAAIKDAKPWVSPSSASGGSGASSGGSTGSSAGSNLTQATSDYTEEKAKLAEDAARLTETKAQAAVDIAFDQGRIAAGSGTAATAVPSGSMATQGGTSTEPFSGSSSGSSGATPAEVAAETAEIAAVQASTSAQVTAQTDEMAADQATLSADQLAVEEAMKAAGYRGASVIQAGAVSFDESAQVRDLDNASRLGLRDEFSGSFVGESGSSGASNFLPAGPTKKQDDAITKEQTSGSHRFQGNDLAHCTKCGQAVTAVIHRVANEVPGTKIPMGNGNSVLRSVSSMPDGNHLTTEPHRFRGGDPLHCEDCGEPKHMTQHLAAEREGRHLTIASVASVAKSAASKAPGQPIPPIPREASLLRHSGLGHLSVPTGHVKGVPSRHRAAARAANTKNVTMVEGPLHQAVLAHLGEQRRATINRLMGKRGGRMLKRAMQLAPTTALAIGASYASPVPAPLPGPDDLNKSTLEPNTTSPIDQPHGLNGPVVVPDVSADINPGEIFDSGFWSGKLAGVLHAHLITAGVLASNEVKSQVGLASGIDDGPSQSAVESVLADRAAAAAQAVTNTTARGISGALLAGVARGESRPEIASRLTQVFDDAESDRAPQIARTVAGGGYNEAAHAYASHLAPEHVGNKVWLSGNPSDKTHREGHVEADLQEQPLGSPFNVGGAALRFPGDVGAPISEWAGCGCTAAYMPPNV